MKKSVKEGCQRIKMPFSKFKVNEVVTDTQTASRPLRLIFSVEVVNKYSVLIILCCIIHSFR